LQTLIVYFLVFGLTIFIADKTLYG